MKGGINIMGKVVIVTVLLILFGGVFLFSSSGGTEVDGTFNELLDVSDTYANQGNVTGWTGIMVVIMPIAFIVTFILLIGYAIFR